MLGSFKSHRKMQIGKMCWEWSRIKSLHGILGNKPQRVSQSISNFGWHTVTEGKILATSQPVAWLPLASMRSWSDPQCMKGSASSSVLLGWGEGLHHLITTLSDTALTYRIIPTFETLLGTTAFSFDSWGNLCCYTVSKACMCRRLTTEEVDSSISCDI